MKQFWAEHTLRKRINRQKGTILTGLRDFPKRIICITEAQQKEEVKKVLDSWSTQYALVTILDHSPKTPIQDTISPSDFDWFGNLKPERQKMLKGYDAMISCVTKISTCLELAIFNASYPLIVGFEKGSSRIINFIPLTSSNKISDQLAYFYQSYQMLAQSKIK